MVLSKSLDNPSIQSYRKQVWRIPDLLFFGIFAAMYTHKVHLKDCIVAIATAQGVGALGIVRLSGEGCFEICNKVFDGVDLSTQKSHSIHYGYIVDGQEKIDEVLISVFKGRKSFTAEDSIEISCHGSPYIQSKIVELLQKNGARLAEPGEFSLRAYLNGRIDLAQAEAVADMIAAQNQSQLNIAMNQMRGGLSKQLNELREKLLNFISLIELELDFGEEDVEFADRTELKQQLLNLKAFIRPMIESFQLGNAIKNGVPVAIIGKPNAGKSSLLNVLLNEDRAIVSDIAGTTRDTIEEEININNIAYRFIDTAGIRQTEDTIEKIGISKAFSSITKASAVIYIFDARNTSVEEINADIQAVFSHNPAVKLIVLGNKLDLLEENELETLNQFLDSLPHSHALIQLKTNLQEEVEKVKELLKALLPMEQLSSQSCIVSNQRHHSNLLSADESIDKVLELMAGGSSSDLIAFDMRRAVDAIGDITGTISNDEVLGNIFGKFCIGK
jgi:tRNA modification GTPase